MRIYYRIVLALAVLLLILTSSQSAARAVVPTDPVPVEPLPDGAVLETVLPSAHQLVAMAFTPDGRLLYTEKFSGSDPDVGGNAGYVRVVNPGQTTASIVYKFPVDPSGERGLLGIAVDPQFTLNHRVWAYFTKLSPGGTLTNRVAWFILNDDNSTGAEGIAASFPVDYYVTVHNGGNLHFGPDGKLYVTVGNNNDTNDASDPAQDLTSPLGKIHRFNPTLPLTAPADNPFYTTSGAVKSIYAYGLRNSFDFEFDPISHQLFATENGDACDDEINLIVRGGDYGWHPFYPDPLYHLCDDEKGPPPQYNTLPPLIYWTPSLAPTGLTFYTGDLFPEWKNDLFMCSFKDTTTALHHFKLNASRTALTIHTVIGGAGPDQMHCRTDVETGPDGALYYSQDGGYTSGPLMRITRPSSYVASTVDVSPVAVPAGGLTTYTLNVRHVGTLSNTFNLTATLLPSMTLQPGSIQYHNGTLTEDADHIYWTGLLSHTETWSATYQVKITDTLISPTILTSSIDLSAPAHATFHFTPTIIVNGYSIFLPVIRLDL